MAHQKRSPARPAPANQKPLPPTGSLPKKDVTKPIRVQLRSAPQQQPATAHTPLAPAPAPTQTTALPLAPALTHSHTHSHPTRRPITPPPGPAGKDRPPASPLTPTIAFSDLDLNPVPPIEPLPSSSAHSVPITPDPTRPPSPSRLVGRQQAAAAATTAATTAAAPDASQPSQSHPAQRAQQSQQQQTLAAAPTPSSSSSSGAPQPDRMTHPPPPVDQPEEDNTDMMAVKAALSILQMQQEKAKRDIRTLARLRDLATDDPAGFTRTLQQRAAEKARLSRRRSAGKQPDRADPALFLQNTLRHWDAGAGAGGDGDGDGDGFPEIPEPQNIAHCPSVNWAKYAIVPGPIKKMHAEQLARPIQGEPMALLTRQHPPGPADGGGSGADRRHQGPSAASSSSSSSKYVPASRVHPDAVNPALRQELDYFGRAPVHTVAGPVDPFDAHERVRVGMRPGGWAVAAPPPPPPPQKESRRAARRSLQH